MVNRRLLASVVTVLVYTSLLVVSGLASIEFNLNMALLFAGITLVAVAVLMRFVLTPGRVRARE